LVASDAHAQLAAEIAARAIRSGLDAADATRAIEPTLLALRPGQSATLDAILADFAKSYDAEARGLLSRWLNGHGAALARTNNAFVEVFPRLAQVLGQEREAEWLVSFLSAQQPLVRVCAVNFVAFSHQPMRMRKAVALLTPAQAEAIVHVLIASARPCSKWISLPIDLLIAHPSLLALRELLLTDIADDYPATVLAELRRVAGGGDLKEEARDLLRATLADVEQRTRDRDSVHEQKVTLPEIVTTRPAAEAWRGLQARIMATAIKEGEKRSLFRQIATRVPLARGSKSLMSGLDGKPTEIEQHSFSAEFPLRDLFDPVGATLRRMEHSNIANRLLTPSAAAPPVGKV
jgi:hypothetical protein